jgi:hyaluronan synthase
VVTVTIIFVYLRRYDAAFPITIESIWQILLAEVNRRKNISRIQRITPVGDEELGLKEEVIGEAYGICGGLSRRTWSF